MDLTSIPILKMVTGRMSWLTKRQEVLSQNIANADTPNYVPQDLKKQDFGSLLKPAVRRTMLHRTASGHMEAIRHPPKQRHETVRDTYEVAPAGNSVILEEQLMKVADTQGQYRLATNLYSKHVSMLKQAIGRDRG